MQHCSSRLYLEVELDQQLGSSLEHKRVSSLNQVCEDTLEDGLWSGQAHAVEGDHCWDLHKQHCRSMLYLEVKLGQQLGSSL